MRYLLLGRGDTDPAVREIIRDIGPDRTLMVDATQSWDVGQAIDWVRALAFAQPWFIEEPTSPDDVAGHRAIREAQPHVRRRLRLFEFIHAAFMSYAFEIGIQERLDDLQRRDRRKRDLRRISAERAG